MRKRFPVGGTFSGWPSFQFVWYNRCVRTLFSKLLPHSALRPVGALFLRVVFNMCSILAVSAHSCRLMASYAQGLSTRPFPPRLFRECVFGWRFYPIAMTLYYSGCNFPHSVPIGPLPKGKRFRSGGAFSRQGVFRSVGPMLKRFPVGRNVFRSVGRC